MRKGINRYFNILKRKIFRNSVNKLIILLYHRIGEKNNQESLLPSIVNASIFDFEKEVHFLSENFNVISINEAMDALVKKTVLPDRNLVITFDDGYRDNYLNAFPIIKKYKIPATIFLTSDFIDSGNALMWTDRVGFIINRSKKDLVNIPGLGSYNLRTKNQKERAKIAIIEELRSIGDTNKNRGIDALARELDTNPRESISERLYLSREEISEMKDGAITFGSHGCSHAILSRVTLKEAEKEIVGSKAKIEKIIDKKIELFAYPNGTCEDFDNNIVEILKKSGFRAAFTAIAGYNRINDNLNLFSLKRIPAGRSFSNFRKNMFLYS